jgi:iron complex outermembrane recepter protein
MNPTTSRIASLMGTASLITLAAAAVAHAQEAAQAQTAPTLLTQVAQALAQVAQAQMAQAAPETVPEQVLITGSLIHGTAAVGVPVTNLGVQDFTQTGAVTIADLFRTVPAANVAPGPSAVNSGGHQERETRVNIRGLDQTGPRSLLMVDGVRFPPQADGLCAIDPSIIPALALDRVDILPDGASATYGSDAIAGVINVVLKRGFDGAVTLLHVGQPTDGGGGTQYQASQLWGRTWNGGDVTLTYEYTQEQQIPGTVHSNFTMNYSPWGLDDEIPIGSSLPGTITVGAPSVNNGLGVKGVGTVCSNCFAVPHGGGTAFNPALNNGLGPLNPSQAGAAFSSYAAGVNEIDPLKTGWELAAQTKNSAVGTLDQTLFPGVSFFFTGFYANRRVTELLPSDYSQGVANDLHTFIVPTTNPYYPTGAPSNLQVAYNFSYEIPPNLPAYEISYRGSGGLNLDLPFNWNGQLYYSYSYETNKYLLTEVNDNAASVALGNTVGGVNKPAAIPYLNLFCDPTAFRCNSPQTLAYIAGQRYLGDIYQINERGAKFDGPIPFNLPAGQIKVAVGATYESDTVTAFTANNAGNPAGTAAQGNTQATGALAPLIDVEPDQVWAEFTQVDVPVFGDNFSIPLVRRLDIEGSFRHDSYSGALVGATSNPKVAFTWLIDETIGATVRGSWGTSFRFANAGEFSTVASDANADFNFNGQPGPVTLLCSGGAPTPGTTAAALVAAGWACGSQPGGIGWAGGPHPQLRAFTTPAGVASSREGGTSLAPETGKNYSIGVELAPQFAFLRGLDLQATWYSVKVNGTLLGFTNTTTSTLNQVSDRFHVIIPSDLGCPTSANLTPATCAPFEAMAAAALLDRNSPSAISFLTNVAWINDGSTVGTGFLHPSGVDYNASYDFDAGDFGAWNVGITGTYYLHFYQQTAPGTPIIDWLNQPLAAQFGVAMNGVESTPRMLYRARLGWSDGAFNVTGFMNFVSHYFRTWATPPNVNLQCTASGGTVGGGSFPCAISNYTSIIPSIYTFDLSFGYNTGDTPANDYLKRITIQLTIDNLLGKHSPFDYGPSTSTRNISAYDILFPNEGRVIGLTLLKNW